MMTPPSEVASIEETGSEEIVTDLPGNQLYQF
jgi:hypothetical protein